jgi:hypothetical protein
MGDLIYSGYKYGFDKYVSDRQNGQGEYNNQQERTSTILFNNIYEIVSKFRGDTVSIIKMLQNPTDSYGTVDIEGDQDVFMIKVIDNTTYFLAETIEDITVLEGSSIFGDYSLNLYMTPMRSFLRHGNRLSAGMAEWQESSILRWQTSNKDTDLITSFEGVELRENDNVKYSQLLTPIFRPIKHIVTSKFTVADLAAITANPYGLVKLTSNLYGYILSIKKKNKEDKATIEIIEAVI